MNWVVSYSFKNADGGISRHHRGVGACASEQEAISRALPYLPQFVRDNLVSISALDAGIACYGQSAGLGAVV